MKKIPLVGKNYTAQSATAAQQDCINVYPEKIEDPDETQKGGALLIGCPGRHLFKTMTTIDAAATPFRGIWSGGGRLFVAGGTKYFELSPAGALVGSVRTIADDAQHSPVIFFSNGNQRAIFSAGTVYIDNGSGPNAITLPALSGTFSALGQFVDWVSGDYFDAGMQGQTITLAGTPYTVVAVLSGTTLTISTSIGGAVVTGAWSCSPAMVCTSLAFLNGYFLASRANSRQVNASALNDGSNSGTYVWNPLGFGIKESYPDLIRSILAPGDGQLYMFGTESMEVWTGSTGGPTFNADFPFERIDGATNKFGSSSVNGPIEVGGRVYFLGGSQGQLTAYVLDGYTPRRVSTFSEEYQWGGFGAGIVSWEYLEEGHQFWCITFAFGASGLTTWAYDTVLGVWHLRARYVASNFVSNGIFAHTFVTNSSASANDWGADGKHIVGGEGGAKVWEQKLTFYDDEGTDMKWRRSLPYEYNDGNRMYFGRMEMEMETGTVASGAEPVITRDYSDNRGNSYVNPQTAGIGVHNNFTKRVFWPSGGSSRGRIWRFYGVGQSKVGLVTCVRDRTDGTN